MELPNFGETCTRLSTYFSGGAEYNVTKGDRIDFGMMFGLEACL
jgi:hypothetical protein